MAWSFGEKVAAVVAAAAILFAIPRLLLFSLAQLEGVAVVALIGVEEAVAALLLLSFRYVGTPSLSPTAGGRGALNSLPLSPDVLLLH